MHVYTTYKKIKHGYVRIDPDGSMRLSIPLRKKNDQRFHQLLLAKGRQLLEKHTAKSYLYRWDDEYVSIYGEQISRHTLPKDIKAYLTQRCYEDALPTIERVSKKIGIKHNKLRIRSLRSKWGSCSGTQNISLNRDLVHLPKKFLDYVAIHEACHLQHKHHQASFWKLVAEFCPEYKLLRKELNTFLLR